MNTLDIWSIKDQSYKGISIPDSNMLNPYLDIETFTRHSQVSLFNLPTRILSSVMEFRSTGNQDGFILIKGLPCDENLINTPRTHEEAQSRELFVSEYCLTMIGAHLGELYGFSQESNGAIFNNIRPSPQQSDQQSSESSDVFLELHTEIAFHEFRPDFILLYCLRQDHHKTAKTGVASIRHALPLLSQKTRSELLKPNFSFASDLSFGNITGKENIVKTTSILEGDITDPYMTYDSDLITPQTEGAKEALLELDTALRNTMQEIALESGDLIIVDNRRTSHSRTHFKAYYDGQDRWLQRSFVKQELDSVRKRLPGQAPIIKDVF